MISPDSCQKLESASSLNNITHFEVGFSDHDSHQLFEFGHVLDMFSNANKIRELGEADDTVLRYVSISHVQMLLDFMHENMCMKKLK